MTATVNKPVYVSHQGINYLFGPVRFIKDDYSLRIMAIIFETEEECKKITAYSQCPIEGKILFVLDNQQTMFQGHRVTHEDAKKANAKFIMQKITQ